ncbi:hypothetical protein DXG01_008669 [Tephrocybe rancida]|nr:hypothetical protein DXG01_008669 [Tephrocybe rancida]
MENVTSKSPLSHIKDDTFGRWLSSLPSPMLHMKGIWAILCLTIRAARAALPACSNSEDAVCNFIVVGAGAGGGPLASRLAESGYSVLLLDAGHGTVNVNTTLPAYSLRSLEGTCFVQRSFTSKSEDVVALREGIKRTRKLVASTPIGRFVDTEIASGPDVTTDEEMDNYILNRVFGHHA